MNADPSPLEAACDLIRPYGYTMLLDGTLVTPKGRLTSVKLTAAEGGRYQVRITASNKLLWSGTDPGKFLAGYWYAEKVRT